RRRNERFDSGRSVYLFLVQMLSTPQFCRRETETREPLHRQLHTSRCRALLTGLTMFDSRSSAAKTIGSLLPPERIPVCRLRPQRFAPVLELRLVKQKDSTTPPSQKRD